MHEWSIGLERSSVSVSSSLVPVPRLRLRSILQFILRWRIVSFSRIAISRLKFKNYFSGWTGRQTHRIEADSLPDIVALSSACLWRSQLNWFWIWDAVKSHQVFCWYFNWANSNGSDAGGSWVECRLFFSNLERSIVMRHTLFWTNCWIVQRAPDAKLPVRMEYGFLTKS